MTAQYFANYYKMTVAEVPIEVESGVLPVGVAAYTDVLRTEVRVVGETRRSRKQAVRVVPCAVQEDFNDRTVAVRLIIKPKPIALPYMINDGEEGLCFYSVYNLYVSIHKHRRGYRLLVDYKFVNSRLGILKTILI